MLGKLTNVEAGEYTMVKATLHAIRLDPSLRQHHHDLARELRASLVWIFGFVKVIREPVKAGRMLAGIQNDCVLGRTHRSGRCRRHCSHEWRSPRPSNVLRRQLQPLA